MRLISIILAMWGFSGCGVLNPKDDGKSGGQPPTVNYRDGQYADFGLDTDDSISQRYTVNGQERLNIKLLRIFKNQHIRGDLNFVIAAKEGVNLFASGDVANGTSASLVLNEGRVLSPLVGQIKIDLVTPSEVYGSYALDTASTSDLAAPASSRSSFFVHIRE